MDELLFVGVVQGVGELADHLANYRQGQQAGPAAKGQASGLERRPANKLHGYEGHAVKDIEVVDLDNIRVAQDRDCAGLAGETLKQFGIACQMRVDDLERHEAVEAGLVGAVDSSHATAPELLKHTVAPKGSPAQVLAHGSPHSAM